MNKSEKFLIPMARMTMRQRCPDMMVARDGTVGSIFLSASMPSVTSAHAADFSGGNGALTRYANLRSLVMRPPSERAVLPYET